MIWPRWASTGTARPAACRKDLVHAPVAAMTASPSMSSPPSLTPAAAAGQVCVAVPDHGALPDRGPGQRGRQLPAVDPGRAADVHRGGVRPQRREQPLRVRAGEFGHVADLRCRGPARQQRLADLLTVFFALGQGERSDLPVAHVGFAEIGQASGQRRVLPGGGAGQCAPRRVRHLRGPRADDARSGRGGPARLRGVHQQHLGAERAGHIRTRGPDDARADHDQPQQSSPVPCPPDAPTAAPPTTQ